MSSTEKILVSIFERKDSIIEQLKEQSRSFDNYLASMCLLQRLEIPPWIFSKQDSNAFKKEDIISGLLLPLSRPSALFPDSISQYRESTVTTYEGNYAGNRLSVIPQFADEDPCTSRAAEELDVSVSHYLGLPTGTTDDGIDVGCRLSAIPQFSDEAPCTSRGGEKLDVSVSCYSGLPTVTTDDGIDAGCKLSVIAQSAHEAPCTSRAAEELDVSVSSPLECGGVEHNEQGHVQSLERIHRSKSRQKALQLRNSAKAARNSSHDEENCDGYCIKIEGSGVISLHYDHVDEAELCELVSAENETCTEEAAKAGEFGCYGSQLHSMNEQENVGDPSDIAKGEGLIVPSIKLAQQPNNSMELLQPANSSVYANANFAAKEIGSGDCTDNKQNRNERMLSNSLGCRHVLFKKVIHNQPDLYSIGIRKSETSSLLLSSAKEPCNVSNSCYSANQVRYELIDGSIEQLNLVDGLLQSAKPSSAISGKSSRAEESKHGIKRSSEMDSNTCRRITRSRSSRQKPILVSDGLNAEEAKHGIKQSNDKDSNSYIGRITRFRSSRQKPILISDDLNLGESRSNVHKGGDDKTKKTTNAPSLSHFYVNKESSNLKGNTFGSERNKEEFCSGDSSRSRSCSKSIKCTSECPNLDYFSGKNNGDSIGKLKQQANPDVGSMTVIEDMDMADESLGAEGMVLDYQNIEDETDASGGRIKKSRSSRHQLVCVEYFPLDENASNIAEPPHSDILQLSCSGQEAAADLQKASVNGQNILPFTECYNFVDLQGDNVAVMETEVDCAQRVEAYSIVSGSDSVEANPGLEYDVIVAETDMESAGQVDPCSVNAEFAADSADLGMETLDSRPSAEFALPMKPKEVDFDHGQDFRLTETCNLGLESKQKNTSPEMRSSIQHGILDNISSVNREEKPTSSAEMLLPKQRELCEIDKIRNIPFEAHLENSAALAQISELNSEPWDMNTSHFEDRIADSCLMGSWPCHKQVQKGGELYGELSSSASVVMKPFQCNQIEHDVVRSTVDGQQQNAQLYIINQPDLLTPNLQVEQSPPCSEGRDKGGSVSLLNEHLETFSVSSPVESFADWVSQALLTSTSEAKSISGALNAGVRNIAEENEAHLQLEDNFEPASMGSLMDSVRIDIEGSRNLTSLSAMSPSNDCQVLVSTEQNMPELEGFVMETDDDHGGIVENGFGFANVGYPRTEIERASLIEQLCKSACLHTPLSHLSATFELHKSSIYQSTPAGLLEGLKTWDTPTVNADISMQFQAGFDNEHNFVFTGSSSSDCLISSSSQSAWDIKNPFVSPVGEFWSGITSKSGSSGKRLSTNPELPSISEENECMDELAKTLQQDTVTEKDRSVKREPLADITKILNPLLPVCVLDDRCSVASVNRIDNRRNHVSKPNENGSLLPSNVMRANGSLNSRTKLSKKLSLKRENSNIHKRESKQNNIVSNITSFIPLVQKQADANITGKRDVKVKSLEAAEVARRNLEKKEIERKIRKEALQRDRAQKEQENLKQMELDKEKKEEERKKKLADMAAKKRQREEEEKKERERKRKCVEEKRRQLAEDEEKKLRTKKENKELKSRAVEKKALENKEPRHKLQKHENTEKAKGDNNLVKVPENGPTGASTIDIRELSTVARSFEDLSGCGENLQVMSHASEAIQDNNLDLNKFEEKSYEISPYKSSDDEDDDEEDDDIRKSKFVPSWASKNHLAIVVSSQQKINPKSIFSLESFCNIAEVLLPRRLQQKVAPN